MLQRKLVTSLIGFCPPDFAQGVSHFERRSELTGQLEGLLVPLARRSPLALRMQRDSQLAQARVEQPAVARGSRTVGGFARERLGLEIMPLADREICEAAE